MLVHRSRPKRGRALKVALVWLLGLGIVLLILPVWLVRAGVPGLAAVDLAIGSVGVDWLARKWRRRQAEASRPGFVLGEDAAGPVVHGTEGPSSHVLVVGPDGAKKSGVLSSLAAQGVRYGWSVVCFDTQGLIDAEFLDRCVSLGAGSGSGMEYEKVDRVQSWFPRDETPDRRRDDVLVTQVQLLTEEHLARPERWAREGRSAIGCMARSLWLLGEAVTFTRLHELATSLREMEALAMRVRVRRGCSGEFGRLAPEVRAFVETYRTDRGALDEERYHRDLAWLADSLATYASRHRPWLRLRTRIDLDVHRLLEPRRVTHVSASGLDPKVARAVGQMVLSDLRDAIVSARDAAEEHPTEASRAKVVVLLDDCSAVVPEVLDLVDEIDAGVECVVVAAAPSVESLAELGQRAHTPADPGGGWSQVWLDGQPSLFGRPVPLSAEGNQATVRVGGVGYLDVRTPRVAA